MKIEVIDKDGWRKAFSCEKTLFHIGSAAMNDLILDARRGAGVSARHAQLIALPDGAGYRLVNLGDANILLGENSEKATPVPPHSVGIIANGSVVKIGDYTLIFQGEAVISSSAPLLTGERSGRSLHSERSIHNGRSSHIGLRLSLPYTTLAPHQTLVGKLLIGNHGDRAGVQFDLELEGIESECYRIEPAPLLSSGAESEVAIRFYHRGGKPLAGEHTVVIRAVAPLAYPGEEATVTVTLHVEPFFKHTLKPAPLATPVRARETAIPQDLLPPSIPIHRAPTQRPQPVQSSAPPPPVAIKPAPRTPTPPPEDWWSIPEKATAAAPVAPPMPEHAEPEAIQPAVVQAQEVLAPAPGETVTTPPVEAPVAAPEAETAHAVITPLRHTIEPEAAPAPPLVVEPEAMSEPEVAAPAVEAVPPVAEPTPTVEAVAETSAQAVDDWWGVSEPPSTEKPEVLVLKAAPVTPPEPPAATETAPEDETDAEQKPVSADDDWWSET